MNLLRNWLNCHLRNEHVWGRAFEAWQNPVGSITPERAYIKRCRFCSATVPVKRRLRGVQK